MTAPRTTIPASCAQRLSRTTFSTELAPDGRSPRRRSGLSHSDRAPRPPPLSDRPTRNPARRGRSEEPGEPPRAAEALVPDHLRAHADLLRRRGEGMQAAFGNDFTQQNIPGGDRQVVEDAFPQNSAVRGEPVLPKIIPAETRMHRPEGLGGFVERARRRRRDPVEGLPDVSLATPCDIEPGGVNGAARTAFPGPLLPKEALPQEPAEGRRGVKGLSLEPGVIPAIPKPTVEPEIIRGWRRFRPVEGARQDVSEYPGQTRPDILPIPRSVRFPEGDQGVTVPDAGDGGNRWRSISQSV